VRDRVVQTLSEPEMVAECGRRARRILSTM
jgi:hypothetical protein